MPLFTNEEMTNLFLYGQKDKPDDLTSDSLIRLTDDPSHPDYDRAAFTAIQTVVDVDINDYMAEIGYIAKA